MEEWESDSIVEKWILEHDNTIMPLPSIELNPHLLISKVRKHYMEYLIRLLSVNYENNQKLSNKNIYLPSAIWRCAKLIEMSAAQTAMVVNLYRQNIMNVVQELKKTTKNGMLYKKLSECLLFQPDNEKKTQTTFFNNDNTYNYPCVCSSKTKVRKPLASPVDYSKNIVKDNSKNELKTALIKEQSQYPEEGNVNSSKINSNLKTDTKESDELMLQMEKIFKSDLDDDDIFNSTVYDDTNHLSKSGESIVISEMQLTDSKPIVELQESQANGLRDRLTLVGGDVENNSNAQNCTSAKTKNTVSKWLCEEYFMKVKLYELLDQIRDCDRKKLARIKEKLRNLFGDDSDDEDVVSPLDESPEFVMSCRERIAPWVVNILTPYYVSGRIMGKNLFKALAKHLIKLIYQCSKYPYEYEVKGFVKDFLDNHKIIRCEADFKQFKIENV